MYKGYSETNTLRVGEFTRGEPSRRGTRLAIRLGMKKKAYMGRGHSVGRIHKNTRGITKPGEVIGWKTTNEHTDLPNLRGGGEELVRQQERIHSVLLEGITAQCLIGQPNR